MINLMPPALKEEIRYSKRNAALVRYVVLALTVAIILAGALLGARYLLDQQTASAQKSIEQKRSEIKKYKSLEENASGLNGRLDSIQSIQKAQAKFSVLLNDLAQHMPSGTAISSMTLTGDDKKPVRLTVSAADYRTALGFRDSIIQSERISAADIESIQKDSAAGNNLYTVIITFSFTPGGAK